MTRDDEQPENTIERSRRFVASSADNTSRQEPSFSNLDELHEDGYEEPDRDTDFTSGYRADSVEDEEEYEDTLSEGEERESFADDRFDTSYDPGQTLEEDSDSWLEEDPGDREEEGRSWPLGLIGVGIFALVLLAAGGYGVLQQRADAQEEIQELRAALAVAASPADARANRGALETLQQSYDTLSAQAQALTLENRRLADTVAGLEAQLGIQQTVPGKEVAVRDRPDGGAVAAPNAVVPESTATTAAAASPPRTTAPEAQKAAPAKPVSPAPNRVDKPAAGVQLAASNVGGPWFVNFGTYATRNMADTWASRVRPSAGEVIVVPNEKDGKTLFRVRVVGLTDRESAQQVARKLESDLRVPQLWVGRE